MWDETVDCGEEEPVFDIDAVLVEVIVAVVVLVVVDESDASVVGFDVLVPVVVFVEVLLAVDVGDTAKPVSNKILSEILYGVR